MKLIDLIHKLQNFAAKYPELQERDVIMCGPYGSYTDVIDEIYIGNYPLFNDSQQKSLFIQTDLMTG